MPEQHPATRSSDTNSSKKRIHILGTGNIGNFVAHSLAEKPDPPQITLLLHRAGLLDSWKERGQKITVIRDGASHDSRGIDVELTYDEAQNASIIDNLIVSVKAQQTVTALGAIKHRLSPESNILFLQNGMGAPEEANEKLFPEQSTRPNYIQGVITHGIWSKEPFVVTHAAPATTSLGIMPRSGSSHLGTASNAPSDLVRALTDTPVLVATEYPYTDLLQLQLEKLIVNSIANPLTAILNHQNSVLLTETVRPIIHSLVLETTSILHSFPELQGVPGIETRFAPDRIEDLVMDVFVKVQRNFSSMYQDMRAGKRTEIGYINGYFVRRATEMGMKCDLNSMLVQMVRAKEEIAEALKSA
jgi:2-dehydropantoate 2-reductase